MTAPTPTPAPHEGTGPPPAWLPRHRRVGLTVKWVAILAAVLGILAIAWPEAARPLVSVLAGVVLAAMVVEAFIAIVSRVPQPSLRSPFEHRPGGTAAELPGELTSILNGMKGFDPRRTVPPPTFWALRRIAGDRIALRHGRRVTEQDADWLRPIVSAELFAVLAAPSSEPTMIRGDALPALLTEIEAL
ncbi:hypothetical protein [Desertimonas flava]|uniref:hypothetical protein n=1 Tax=Desertimonas flava TaxID=2064846 RepID=UPI000E3549F2|nr:hypothetical protein [Desertimonas flava]